jgi:hypothetical protein
MYIDNQGALLVWVADSVGSTPETWKRVDMK